MTILSDWKSKGFSYPPERKVAPPNGMLIYRAWGSSSTERSGYFSLEKPESVLDAELRFNIEQHGNGVHFVSTFRLKEGFEYFVGPIAHGERDLSKPASQVFVDNPIVKVVRVGKFQVLLHDFTVVRHEGSA